MRLADKVILITGSTTGIGEAMARRFVREGARVMIHGTRADAAAEVAGSLGEAAAFHVGDLAEATTAPTLIEATLAYFGRLDAVVNNAAWVPKNNLTDLTLADWESVMAINLRAPFLLIQAALPALAEAKGAVLNIGSVNAYCGEPNLLAYSVSKGGLTTLSRNLGDALHQSHGVRVNQINPGWVLTENEIQKKQAFGLPPDWHRHVPPVYAPSGGLIPAETIAAAAVYFVGEESRPISGSVVELEQYPFIGRNPDKGDAQI